MTTGLQHCLGYHCVLIVHYKTLLTMPIFTSNWYTAAYNLKLLEIVGRIFNAPLRCSD